ncbi:MAG: hypothetical protein H7A51_13975 [Akkermansiaceae bacterium]|nr:hypothetical protein [Akkermansiaceae bacterium]
MKNHTTLLLLTGLVAAFSSCAKKEDPAPEPVKQPVVQQQAPPPAPVVETNPTNPFRTPADDMKLPTADQIAEGKDSSIGTGSQPVNNPDTAPSVAVTPPSAPATPDAPEKQPKKEDQLAPGE